MDSGRFLGRWCNTPLRSACAPTILRKAGNRCGQNPNSAFIVGARQRLPKVRVSDTGRRTFILVKRFPGGRNPTRLALGEFGALSLERARSTARDWRLATKK